MADGTPYLTDQFAQSRDQDRVLTLTARIVSAHVAHNQVRCSELPSLIQEVCRTLVCIGVSSASPAELVPAVPINRSVFPDYIICLENGRRFRTMRRHLMAKFGLTPEQYRRRWGLPHDYPMVASSYAVARSSLAKTTGLGRASRAGTETCGKAGRTL